MEKEKGKWKSKKRLPKILKINGIKGLTISVLFSDGHNRLLDFTKILKDDWKITKKDPEYKLLDPSEFKKVKLENFTLSWTNVPIEITGFDEEIIKVPFDVGADILYELSELDEAREKLSIGELIRKERIKAGLTQGELGERIGSDKFYISRVEANNFDIEITTLRKIIEGGLHKKLEISIK
jgi:DNA-binding XRE family transcriptional regulator